MAGLTNFLVTDVQANLRPPDRLPEIDAERVFEVRAALRCRRFLAVAALSEKLGEQVLESAARFRGRPRASGRPRAARLGLGKIIGEIESRESHSRSLILLAPAGRESAVGIESLLIVHLPLLRLTQDVVRFLQLLEAVFGGLVAGIEIRMILARQAPVRFPNLILRRLSIDLQGVVIILCRGHG